MSSVTFRELGKMGRLGNQLFQIASTIGIAHSNAMDFCFEGWEYSKYSTNRLPFRRVFFPNEYKEQSSNYYNIVLHKEEDWALSGYFQSWKYFDECKSIIKHYFTPNFTTNSKSKSLVSIHVRRGDYVGSNFHTNLGEDYYRQAMELFPTSKFLVFSDDIDFTIKCGWFDHERCIFKVSEASRDIQVDVPEDLLHLVYMSKCKAHIIANSSFSWWAAYLSGKKTVAPKQWISTEVSNDRLMPDWIAI